MAPSKSRFWWRGWGTASVPRLFSSLVFVYWITGLCRLNCIEIFNQDVQNYWTNTICTYPIWHVRIKVFERKISVEYPSRTDWADRGPILSPQSVYFLLMAIFLNPKMIVKPTLWALKLRYFSQQTIPPPYYSSADTPCKSNAWKPCHSHRNGNEKADELIRAASRRPEPWLPVSLSVVRHKTILGRSYWL